MRERPIEYQLKDDGPIDEVQPPNGLDNSTNQLNIQIMSAALSAQVYEQFARIGKALSAPKRLELLDLLCQGPRTVEVLATLSHLSVANASQHLRVLRAAKLIDAEKKGVFVEYRMADQEVSDFFVGFRRLAESRLAEIDQVMRAYMHQRGALEAVGAEELLQRVLGGEVTVLDVRPIEEYRAAHLPRAVSIPIAELEARLAEVPKDRAVVAYCRGRYCVMALEAVDRLRAAGFEAHRMEHGVAEWRARGLAVVSEAR